MKQTIIDEINSGPGYKLGFHLDSEDLIHIQDLIKSHLVDRVREVNPEVAGRFEEIPIWEYHTASHLINHPEVMRRVNRIMPEEFVSELRRTSLIRQLKDVYGEFSISDEERVGRESVSLRFVRPGSANDVGSLHCDDWFWKIYKFSVPKGFDRIKVWTAICCDTGLSGLYVVPESQKREWKYSVEDKAGMLKPVLDPSEKPALYLCPTRPGEAVVFNYHSLHGGAVTQGAKTRVSIEFTMLVKR